MVGKYASFAELARHETLGRDYRIDMLERPGCEVLVVAPHGGTIENGTSELAQQIAGDEYSFFCFEGLKPRGQNRGLHITSHHFDHPECVALASRHAMVIGVHGCRGESQVFVGGLDVEFGVVLARHLTAAGFPASTEGHNYPGRNPLNICNRGSRGRGAQLEFTPDFREPLARVRIVEAVRKAIARANLPA
ncbi:MAG: poly-gamma-glutamate hydrolase family protein [Gammaproteobacteria bacterium]